MSHVYAFVMQNMECLVWIINPYTQDIWIANPNGRKDAIPA